ncbi:MAG TPA: aminomethyl-transferring glycine dehydrogenase subunit GcvPA [Anaerovoracaceae bacterium]|nr:aminomethyl-transferring glycine dehydrogenase subunit GcvPA [Anaerovoracaceae bacterium]
MHRYIPNTDSDIIEMLDTIGAESMDELFKDIPEELRLSRDLDLEPGISELEISKRMEQLGKKNRPTDELVCFLGAGAYDHYIPSVVKHLAMRSEFYTAYTPYQPEISQGTLQVIFEYQTMISNLTGMDVSNASLYDGATAAAEAAIMAVDSARRNTILVSQTVNPQIRKVLANYMHFRNINLVEVPMKEGVTDSEQLKSIVDKDTAGVIVQNPNFFGIIEDMTAVERITHENKSLLISSVDPISLAILKKPADYGADIVVGDGQALGNSLNYGGPYLGFMATTKKLMRKMPGRIVGQSKDVDGKRAFVLTLQAREQHIRRYKATSNICSNQNLNALIASIYMVVMGKNGLREVAVQCAEKAHYTADKLVEKGRYSLAFDQPFFKEFAITGPDDVDSINDELLKNNILGGYNLNKEYGIKNGILLCVTEKRTKQEIDKLTALMEVL